MSFIVMTTNNSRTASPEVSAAHASELFGQTQGAMVLVGAGLGWIIGGLAALGEVPLVLFLGVLAAATLLLLCAVAVRRSAPGVTEAPWSPPVRRGFWLAFGAEAAAIVVIVAIALLLHSPGWIPPLVALAVGLHFLPLAWVFRRPLYYATGAALCAVCAATIVFVPPQWGMRPLQGWQLSAGLGSGTVLWLSALGMLVQSGRGLREFACRRS